MVVLSVDEFGMTRLPVLTYLEGIIEVKFNVGDHEFRMVDVGGQRSERRKWLNCFEDCTAVLFCVAMNEYDKMLYEEANVNRMHEAVSLFQQTVNSKWFDTVSLILFLNKADLFREKIKEVDLKVCLHELVRSCQ